eukprot:scaffold70372_cov42-Phaeocystis_antarctica.AAC.2
MHDYARLGQAQGGREQGSCPGARTGATVGRARGGAELAEARVSTVLARTGTLLTDPSYYLQRTLTTHYLHTRRTPTVTRATGPSTSQAVLSCRQVGLGSPQTRP